MPKARLFKAIKHVNTNINISDALDGYVVYKYFFDVSHDVDTEYARALLEGFVQRESVLLERELPLMKSFRFVSRGQLVLTVKWKLR